MKASGVIALLVGLSLSGLVLFTTRKVEIDLEILADGSPQLSANGGTSIITVEGPPSVTRHTPEADNAVVIYKGSDWPERILRNLRPGDTGKWIQRFHPATGIWFDSLKIQRGEETFRHTRGLSYFSLLLAGAALAPVAIWLLVLLFVVMFYRKEANG